MSTIKSEGAKRFLGKVRKKRGYEYDVALGGPCKGIRLNQRV